MHKFGKIKNQIMRQGALTAAFYGASLGALITSIALLLISVKVSDTVDVFVYAILVYGPMMIGPAYLGFRWARHLRQRHRNSDVAADPAIQQAKSETPEEQERHYSEMPNSEKFFFYIFALVGWVVRSFVIFWLANMSVSAVLPDSAKEIPLSDWTLSLMGGYVIAGFVWLCATAWWLSAPSIEDTSSWGTHPYRNYVFLFFASLWVYLLWLYK
tara:strand:- start:26 stop:667 length:642 start_codon:yes stop_codon:yes gene_type:complete